MAEYRYDSSKGEVAPTVIDGPPPVDQSALVASLTIQLANMTAERDAFANQRNVMQTAIDAAQDALKAF